MLRGFVASTLLTTVASAQSLMVGADGAIHLDE